MAGTPIVRKEEVFTFSGPHPCQQTQSLRARADLFSRKLHRRTATARANGKEVGRPHRKGERLSVADAPADVAINHRNRHQSHPQCQPQPNRSLPLPRSASLQRSGHSQSATSPSTSHRLESASPVNSAAQKWLKLRNSIRDGREDWTGLYLHDRTGQRLSRSSKINIISSGRAITSSLRAAFSSARGSRSSEEI